MVPSGGAQRLGRETTEHLPHGEEPSRAILLGQSHEESTTHPRGDVAVGLAPDTQVDDIAKMVKSLAAEAGPEASLRCRGRKPEGPAPECLLKDATDALMSSAF